MPQHPIVKELRSQSTWRLLLLSVVTLGIYVAHYIKRQTPIINRHLESGSSISEGLVENFLVLSYVSVAFFGLIMLGLGGPVLELISSVIDLAWTVVLLVWAFKARSRMNAILQAEKGGPGWFHGFWTFMFTALYFNYKVNCLNEGQVAGAEPPKQRDTVAF